MLSVHCVAPLQRLGYRRLALPALAFISLPVQAAVDETSSPSFQRIVRFGYGFAEESQDAISPDYDASEFDSFFDSTILIRPVSLRPSFSLPVTPPAVVGRGLHVTSAIDGSRPISTDRVQFPTKPATASAYIEEHGPYRALESSSFTSLEFGKQTVLGDSSSSWATGWRFDAYDENWSFSVGDEVLTNRKLQDGVLGTENRNRLYDKLSGSRFAFYSRADLRGIHYKDRFQFAGSMSIASNERLPGTIPLGYVFGAFDALDPPILVGHTNDHTAIGPQLGIGTVATSSMWRFEALGTGMIGYGHTSKSLTHRSSLGWVYRTRHSTDHVALHGEFRASASCQLTQSWRFDVSWRWYASGPNYAPADSVDWSSDGFGIRATDSRIAYGDNLFIGLTYNR